MDDAWHLDDLPFVGERPKPLPVPPERVAFWAKQRDDALVTAAGHATRAREAAATANPRRTVDVKCVIMFAQDLREMVESAAGFTQMLMHDGAIGPSAYTELAAVQAARLKALDRLIAVLRVWVRMIDGVKRARVEGKTLADLFDLSPLGET
jgi:hypothetical protein